MWMAQKRVLCSCLNLADATVTLRARSRLRGVLEQPLAEGYIEVHVGQPLGIAQAAQGGCLPAPGRSDDQNETVVHVPRVIDVSADLSAKREQRDPPLFPKWAVSGVKGRPFCAVAGPGCRRL